MNNGDFYIGYLEKMPPSCRGPVRGFVLAAALLLSAGAYLIVSRQNPFSTSTFELGQLTTVEGILRMEPAPMLQMETGKSLQGQAIRQSILLVGFGKHGAEAALEKAEARRGLKLDGKKVQLEGTLIYHDGKTLLELTRGEAAVLKAENAPEPKRLPAELGVVTLLGEIADPKCYFGVMKPGEGKAHRSCAARCIAGGIPPVLKSVSSKGQVQYYIIRGKDGKPANEQFLPVVGEPVQLSGIALQYDDWMVLQVGSSGSVKRLSARFMLDAPMCSGRQLSWGE